MTSCRGRWWFSVEYNGDKWFTYVDFFDEELEGEYEFAVKQLQTRFEERARLAMQLIAANIYDQAPWLVGDNLLALSDDASDDDVEWIKANCLRDAGELDRWQDLFLATPWYSEINPVEFGSDEHIAWPNDLDKTPSYIFNVTKKMLGERLFKSVRIMSLDIDKLACDLHKIPLGADSRAHKP